MPNYRRFLLKNFQSRARELSWTPRPGDTDDTRLPRPDLLLPVTARGGDPELAAQARALAEKWLGDHSSLDANMVNATLSAVAFYGDTALFNRYLDEFRKSKDKQIQRSLLAAMNNFRDPAAIEAGMNALLGGSIPFNDGAGLLFNGQQQAATRKLPLEFLKTHWDDVVAKMPTGGGFDFGSVLPNVGRGYCDTASRDELKGFFAPRVGKFVGAQHTLDETIEAIDLCIANTAAQGPGVAAFLAKY